MTIELPLFDIPFLSSVWAAEWSAYLASGKDAWVRDQLLAWSNRQKLKETSSEAAFIRLFFHDIWGYSLQGDKVDGTFQCHPQFSIARAGQTGGRGEADLALGLFGGGEGLGTPQVMCEFKDINSNLDAPQNRKGNSRSPVKQCFDYLRESRVGLSGAELVEPAWAIVTDMNEFRLYHWSNGLSCFQRFVLSAKDSSNGAEPLTASSEYSSFLRFVFLKMLQPSSLLSERGPSPLAKLLKNQLTHEEKIEEDFYLEYKAYREHLFRTILAANPDFQGTKGKLVRLTQRLLDRCLFILFCEDMGKSLQFPPNLYRDELISYSVGNLYGDNDSFPWDRLKSICKAMDRGGTVGPHQINRFNGGLFEPFPELESLHIPATVFCAEGQGENADTLLRHPLTLLYFSAKYNFGIKDANRGRVIDFYALGRIFEQSITELEIMEAEADGRPSLNLLTKRKRDGVYYTPEWVTRYVVEETVGARLDDIKKSLGLKPENRPTENDVGLYRSFLKDKRRSAPVAGAWLNGLKEYRTRFNHIRVVDPACGSGAFLIQALERLKQEHRWVIDEMERVDGQAGLWDVDAIINGILSHNLYGVDLNPESVEITKLALWMHTASPNKPLSSLDHNIRCGNSLVGADFYDINSPGLFTEEEKERVNAFDWQAAFPEAFTAGGFDCVVGNPPYVKLQHFRRVQDKVAGYLVKATRPDGKPLYASTQTGNFDLYLPFIEKGLSLLHKQGRMGYIAPNVWMMNEYGEALRNAIRHNRQLDRWIDFKSFQVFKEAITYTALQFFTGSPNDNVSCAFAPDGEISHIDWSSPEAVIPYDQLSGHDAWNLLPDVERKLINRLKSECKSLGELCWTKQIFQGLITSADNVYHLTKIDVRRYRSASGEEVILEDTIMRPLVSGPEAKRYQLPKTDTYLLFPYDLSGQRPRLFTPAEMATKSPLSWEYLAVNESTLRKRENNGFDDNAWYRFGRNQNIDKQEMAKLCVAQLVPSMRVAYDHCGEFFFNNVRVNGILPNTVEDGWYLLGTMNSPVVDFIFRRISKPKDGGWFEANKQFIAPLPIPDATSEERAVVADYAKKLQELHTHRRDLVEKFERRLRSAQTVEDEKAPHWLWADVGTVASWKSSSSAPNGLSARELTVWAKSKTIEKLDFHLSELDALLKPGSRMAVENEADEIRLKINGRIVIHCYDLPGTPLIAAQWRHALRDVRVTEAFDGKKLLNLLCGLRKTADANLAQALVNLDGEIADLDQQIATTESHLNKIIYGLYQLSSAEIQLVEGA
ncbi:MAG: Eco57I restriction-modification methylase domain-containing protein [Candidatus Lindowbacteria bacterium]|nr:Eco57I restriction-modification methylase domain-containing protein [Candidatus Lindowbacteria bacterium]